MSLENLKPKRGRKPKIIDENINLVQDTNNIVCNFEEFQEEKECETECEKECETENQIKTMKKRGRKPKGGKIIQQIVPIFNNNETKTNVILHFKCSLKDLHNNLLNNNINSYDITSKKDLTYDVISSTECNTVSNENFCTNDYDKESNNDIEIKEIWKKLKLLQHNLHINNISDKKSACFWCTCDFYNPPIYIPKYYIKEYYHVYGCFCTPECAIAYLMEENIDSSTKFERYHLMNHIYSKIYNYTKNIKPAPNPYYMLDKYYGNLTIQEYRSLLRNERFFLIIDKPLTRILTELHDDNDNFIINNKIIPSNNYQIKRKVNKNQTKTTILQETFGMITPS